MMYLLYFYLDKNLKNFTWIFFVYKKIYKIETYGLDDNVGRPVVGKPSPRRHCGP